MRLLRLDLPAFGCFTDACVDLSDDRGLQLVYGPNEAGKSTALRALVQLLYGIPTNSTDNFLHPYPRLRIGGLIEHSDGTRLEFFRRKGNKRTLLASDGTSALDDSALRGFLGGVDRDQFVTMFGIGHEALVRGGEEIVGGRGEIGATLFAAGAGIAGLRDLRDRLSQEAEALFIPRGTTRTINQRLAELSDTRQRLRKARLPGEMWQRHDRALRDAEKQLAELDKKLSDARQRQSRLQRMTQALPVVGQWRALQTQLEALGDVPDLPPSFADDRRTTEAQLASAEKHRKTLVDDIKRLESQLQELPPPGSVLEQESEIQELQQRLSVYRKAQGDLPALEATQRHLAEEARRLLAEIHPDLELDASDSLRISRQQQVAIQSLGNRHEALTRQERRAVDEAKRLARELKDTETLLSGLPEPRDPTPLKEALARAQRRGDLDNQLHEARQLADELADEVEAAVARLAHLEGTANSLGTLPVPATETCDRYEQELTEATRELQTCQQKLDEARARRAELKRELNRLELEGDVPTEEGLTEARRHREAGWRLIRQTHEGNPPPPEEIELWLAKATPGHDLVHGYELAVQAADRLADRLHREAKRVADRASFAAELAATEQRIDHLGATLDRQQQNLDRLNREWAECWEPVGIRPDSPREMRAWLAQFHAVSDAQRRLRQQRASAASLESARDQQRRELIAEIERSAATVDDLGPSLAAACDRAQTLIARYEANCQQLDQLRRDATALRNRHAAAHGEAEQAAAERASWTADWAEAVMPLRLEADALPEQVAAVLAQTEELFDRLDKCRGYQERIDAIRRDGERFADDVRRVCRKAADDLADIDADRAAEQLGERMAAAVEARRRRDMLTEQLDQLKQKQQEQQQLIDELTARAKTLCREAGCQTIEQLPEVERLSAQAAALQKELRLHEAELGRLAGGAPPSELVDDAERTDVDELPDLLAKATEEVKQFGTRRDELQVEVGKQRQALSSMGTGADAADLAQRAEELTAEIAMHARQYTRLRMAACVLREGIERYRKKSEGPVLRRANQVFKKLTLGSFAGLRVDIDDHGENVLAGVRPNQQQLVPPAGMSDGTCDQLYLALRLASLEHYLTQKEPLPLVVDDILISFDDRRAAAALEVLAELSEKIQVIFFTHHEHLTDLARETIAPERVSFHELPPPKTPEAAIDQATTEGN